MNKGRLTIGWVVLAMVGLLQASSCTAKKKLVSPMAHAAHYEWMSAKMSGELKVESGEFPFSGTLRMRRDSTIWISASALMGIENLRALITQDSVILINRMDQTYLAEPVSSLEQTVHAPSLQALQAMLLGNGTSDAVVVQFGPYLAKIQYSDIHWDEPTTFPMKINKKYERIKL
ncbi:MAG: DUF4292 domain-containing protein [Bacteroidales bacterium]|nr:DUF4292 domain-containing protein [Bacteroidales bacterium]